MDINGNEFRELVRRIMEQVLEEKQNKKTRLYVIFEDFFDVRYDLFLHDLQSQYDVYAVVPDQWIGSPVCRRIQDGCNVCKVVSRTASVDLALADSLTVYPVMSRLSVVKAALGLSDTFETIWIKRCLGEGSRICLLLSGLEKFTGREPNAYAETILSYYRTLLQYGVLIGSWPDISKLPAHASTCASRQIVEKRHILTASDMEEYGAGSIVVIAPGTIITALAKDRAADKNIQFVWAHTR